MAPGAGDKKPDKSYLSSAVDSINPWASSRTTTPTPGSRPDEAPADSATAVTGTPGDHITTPLYGQSLKTYPHDCPPLNVQWFHAVDIPKRKPEFVKGKKSSRLDVKPLGQPKKFSLFSKSDSKAIEAKYQKLLEGLEDRRSRGLADEPTEQTKAPEQADHSTKTDDRVAVNEDFLFDVDIQQRELAPVYWLGPIYEVRRGIWFFQEGSVLRPCEENLASQLEEGYLRMKPWLHPARARSPSGSKELKTDTPGETTNSTGTSTPTTMKPPPKPSTLGASGQPPAQPQAHRLFGTYMNSMVTYQDSNTAWLSSGSMLSWVTTSVYERFAGGGYLSGVKLIRGYTEPRKAKEKEKEKEDKGPAPPVDNIPGLDERQQKLLKRRSAPASTGASTDDLSRVESSPSEVEPQETTLQRQISSLMESEGRTAVEAEERMRKQDEHEIQDDYNAQAGEAQGREIEHIVLVTHGIGQLLGLRMESINFVHDVNVLRKTLKSVYTNSADLKALNSELGGGPGNCRVQVLPVCWRHLLDFPRQRKKGEHDLGDVDGEEDDYPSLEDITVEGAAFARSLISDLALDVLLYQSSYREEISKIVLGEANRILKLFKERNPKFKGKVHVMGHSLGSAILFDILCRQREIRQMEDSRNPLRFWPSQGRQETKQKEPELAFDFDVQDFYCLGSPIGLFQMLKGRTIAARQTPNAFAAESPLNPDDANDPFFANAAATGAEQISPISGLPMSTSSPKLGQLYNIFHPSDPISYRLEPLISPAMSSLKPQALPYTKRGIFGNVAHQGLTGIGAKVGQSVSGLWSTLSAGVASNLLNRSLGLTNEEVARMAANVPPASPDSPAGGPAGAGGAGTDASKLGEKTDERQKQLAAGGEGGDTDGNNPTLIDDELETLFSKFEKKRAGKSDDEGPPTARDVDRKARKLRVEEAKVRALNRNGRVDYNIQEGALDFNPINTIASHMGYWSDADVNHFILSQLLSNQSKQSKRKRGH